MTPQLTLYTRKECCLCEEMKRVVREVGTEVPLETEEIDVDGSPELKGTYGSEVPVLLINGRKAFKYRVTIRELKKRLKREDAMIR